MIDSVAALTPRAEIEGEMGDVQIVSSKINVKSIGVLPAQLIAGCCCIFINQLRDKIGNKFGNRNTTGGNALKFYSSVRVDIRVFR